MDQLRIGLREDRTRFSPGDHLEGAAGWQLDQPPQSVEVRLLWFTRGKGTEDAEVVDTVRFDQPQAADARPFTFQLPVAPYSFSGKLISLIWVVELVALPGKQAARVEFVLAPEGREVTLEGGAK